MGFGKPAKSTDYIRSFSEMKKMDERIYLCTERKIKIKTPETTRD